MPSHYQEITLTKTKKLNLGHRPCEEKTDYSFTICVKESLSEQVGCRTPWDRRSLYEREICTEESQIKMFEQLYWVLMQVYSDFASGNQIFWEYFSEFDWRFFSEKGAGTGFPGPHFFSPICMRRWRWTR